jgi:hypothetical protein
MSVHFAVDSLSHRPHIGKPHNQESKVLNGAIWETFMFLWSCDSASKYAEE